MSRDATSNDSRPNPRRERRTGVPGLTGLPGVPCLLWRLRLDRLQLLLFLLTDDGARPSRRCARWLTSIAFGAFLVCPLVGRAQEASAPSIVEASAEELFELGELEAAREAYERSIEAGGNSPESLALAYRRLGILAAIVNDSEQATQWFERSLVIDAMQQAPEALAPSQRTLFVSIQERRRGESAELLLTHEAELGHARLQVVPRGLPSGWVHHYRARAGSWSGESEAGTFRLGDDAFGDDAFGDDAVAAAIILPLALSKDDTSSYGMPVIEWP